MMRNRCRHFTGIQHKQCDIGIRYEAVKMKPSGGGPYQWPCMLTGGACSACSPYTKEELLAEEAEVKRRMDMVIHVRPVILRTGLKQGRIPCPICASGQLSFTIATNGHVRAQCSDESCVRWME